MKIRDQLSRRLHHFVRVLVLSPEPFLFYGYVYMDINILSAVEVAYLAGLIDGEGTITLTRKHRNENRQLALSISNTEYPLLEFTRQAVGAGKITRKRTTQSHHTASFTYAIYNRQALELIRQLLPYLQSYKAKRAALILQHYLPLTPRNGKYSSELKRKRLEFEQNVLAIKACHD